MGHKTFPFTLFLTYSDGFSTWGITSSHLLWLCGVFLASHKQIYQSPYLPWISLIVFINSLIKSILSIFLDFYIFYLDIFLKEAIYPCLYIALPIPAKGGNFPDLSLSISCATFLDQSGTFASLCFFSLFIVLFD